MRGKIEGSRRKLGGGGGGREYRVEYGFRDYGVFVLLGCYVA